MPLHPLLLPNSTPGPPPTPMGLSQTKGTGSAKLPGKPPDGMAYRKFPPSHAIASLQKKTLQKTRVFPASKWF